MQNSNAFQIYNASAGSGKTFTLVKEYLKILLTSENSFKFQQILAVTFTNKAAGEMKERVIKNLHMFSEFKKNEMLKLICAETNLSEDIVFSRAKNVLETILQNYSAFNITTIDSFTHKLIRTFAYDLELPLNSDVEMDTESLLNEAVDLVISKIGTDKTLTELLVSYSLQKLDDDKSWDISLDLKNFSKIILNETNANQLKLLKKVPIEDFKNLKRRLQKDNKIIETVFKEIATKAISIIQGSGVNKNEFANRGELPNHFEKLLKLKQQDSKSLKFDGRLNSCIEEEKNLFAAKCSDETKEIIKGLGPELISLYYDSKKLYFKEYPTYTLNSLIIESLIPLAVLSYINGSLQDIKEENNILLNAEFNQMISDAIKGEPAPFIYERIGEKYRYYFIDEMQDTSILQWKNLIPLIDNAISSENEFGEQGQLLLVGDAKQSIYRWRGGEAEQFIGLSSLENSSNPFYVQEKIKNLDTNFRSYSEIIQFNNQFFRHISKFLSNNSYAKLYLEGNNQKTNTNEGGFVQLSFVDRSEDEEEKGLEIPKKVFEIIQNLDEGFSKNEVCILVRTKKQGVAVANYLSEQGVSIISSETLLMKNNPKIDFIINLINFLQNPTNKELKVKLLYFIYEYFEIKELTHVFLSRLINLELIEFFQDLQEFNIKFDYNNFIQIPFYERFEYCIRRFNLANSSDSNIQFFLDVVFEYQQKNQASIDGFLEFWELKKDKLSIVAPEGKDSVRIMTIHKAKGLEFPVVIYPFSIDLYRQIQPKVWYPYHSENSLETVLINYGEKLKITGSEGVKLFEERKEELELDNFNILYVALTRAVEQLYIISEKNINAKNEENLKHTSGLFINFLKEQQIWNSNTLDYQYGDVKRVGSAKKDVNKNHIQKKFISNSWKNHDISIVANASLLWDTDQGESIAYGNLIHEILAKIKTRNDIEETVEEYLFKGVIKQEDKHSIIEILKNVVEHEKLSKYFDQNKQVFTEREIITKNKNLIVPDRLVFSQNKVSIIDYKTGKPDKKHIQQINNYANVLKDLNYKIEIKLLVYINDELVVEEA